MNSRLFTQWLGVFGAVAILVLAGACGGDDDSAATDGGSGTAAGTGAAAEKTYRFAYANILDSSPLLKEVADDMVREGPMAGIEVRRFDNNNDAATAINNARLMVLDKPDVVIDWNAVEGVGPAIGEIFADAGIPCVAVNTKIPGCPFFNLVNKKVGVDAAAVMVPIAKEKGWTADDTTVILLAIAGAGGEINAGSRNFYEQVSTQMGMDVVTADEITDKTTTLGRHGIQLDGKALIDASYNVMRTTLQRIPAGRHLMVFAANDDSALGAWRAITNAKREEDVLLASSGANAAAIEHLRNTPQWVAENSVFFEYWSEYLLAMGVAVVEGIEAPEQTFSPQLMLTKENIDQYYEGSEPKQAPPLPPENEYLLETGILQKLGIAD